MFPRHIFAFSHRIFVAAIIAVAALAWAGLLLRETRAQTLSRELGANVAGDVSPGTAYLSGSQQAAAEVISTQKAPMLEMHIANNGLVLLRGVTVISNSRGTVRVSMAWGVSDFTWIVETDSGTKFLTSEGVKETIEDIRVGDIITITGKLKNSATDPVVEANYLRESAH